MQLAALFIQRPVTASLLALALMLAGGLAWQQLPVASLPQVEYPTIIVQANLPGASAETMAATVATPLERALGHIAGITELSSQSLQGKTRVTLQFGLDQDIYSAGRAVQAAINAAASLLPTSLPSLPSYRFENPADYPILTLALTSEQLDTGQLYELAATFLVPKISQLSGISQVQLAGGALKAVRVALNPTALQKYGIALEEVRKTIANSNLKRPQGVLENSQFHWQIQSNDQIYTAKDYQALIVSYRQQAPVRIADLGEVYDSVEDVHNIGLLNGKPALLLMLKKQPNANVIATVDQVQALLPELNAELSHDVKLALVADRSLAIRAAMQEVAKNLLLAMVLVILVVASFLGNIRATLVAIIAIPVALLSTCLVMYFCQFSLNNLTMMALIIATGFVVDDAIVVVENTRRHIESGMTPLTATLTAVREVGFTLLAISLSLLAVFIPLLLMGGLVGRIFREFAVTLSAAVMVSLLVSLLITPALCAHNLTKLQPISNRVLRRFAGLIAYAQQRYTASLSWALQHGRLVLTLLFATMILNVYLYNVIDKGFLPNQDGGRVHGILLSDQGASSQFLESNLRHIAELLREEASIQDVIAYAGGGMNTTMAFLNIVLQPHASRPPLTQVIQDLRNRLNIVPGAKLLLFPEQEIRIGGREASGSYVFALQSDNLDLLQSWTPKVIAALNQQPELKDVYSNQQDQASQINLLVAREVAQRYGITQAMIDTSLYNAFGDRQVSTIYNTLNQNKVIMSLAPAFTQSPEALKIMMITVPDNGLAAADKQVPLASIATFAPGNSPLSISHQGQFATTLISFSLADQISLSQATTAITTSLQALGLPTAVKISFQGSAKVFQEALRTQPWLMLAALVCVYIVLGILYESIIHPLTILATLPTAGVGALLALMLCKIEFSLIALIGIILLIGIVKKNAIMMIDFALYAERQLGLDTTAAILLACSQRFRPIMMTTVAALFGALPLAFSTGYGAELRQPLGIAIVGGLLFSQVLTLYTTPVVYLYLHRFSRGNKC